jgi:hypothetical protein
MESTDSERPLCTCHGEEMLRNGSAWAPWVCRVKARARVAAWYAANRERRNATDRERYTQNALPRLQRQQLAYHSERLRQLTGG